jgi:hypothetical protein
MALAGGRLFVPWLDFPTREAATGIPGGIEGSLTNFENGRGGFTAVDTASGKMLWQRKLPSMTFGAATVAKHGIAGVPEIEHRCTIPGHSESGMKGVFTVR